MKKLNVMVLSVLFIFASCKTLPYKKNNTKVKKVNTSETPVPEFTEIEKYIRTSYKGMSSDEIRRETFIAESPYLDLSLKDLIIKGNVRVGMYKEEVYASMGKAQNRIQYPTDFGIKEEWIYSENICHFENGVLKSVEKIKR